MGRNGLAIDENLVVEGNYKYNGGYEAAKRLLAGGELRFSALLASNDLMAFGAYKFFEESGLAVPRDISIAGFDNISYPPVLRPLITTIEIPAYELGKKATEMLFALIRGEDLVESRVVFDPVLMDKGSVARNDHTPFRKPYGSS